MKELRKMIKDMLIAQKGQLYNFNINNLRNKGYSYTEVQNAISYFRFSPQQRKFREMLNMN